MSAYAWGSGIRYRMSSELTFHKSGPLTLPWDTFALIRWHRKCHDWPLLEKFLIFQVCNLQVRNLQSDSAGHHQCQNFFSLKVNPPVLYSVEGTSNIQYKDVGFLTRIKVSVPKGGWLEQQTGCRSLWSEAKLFAAKWCCQRNVFLFTRFFFPWLRTVR